MQVASNSCYRDQRLEDAVVASKIALHPTLADVRRRNVEKLAGASNAPEQ